MKKTTFQMARLAAELNILTGVVLVVVASVALRDTVYQNPLYLISLVLLLLAVAVIYIWCRCPRCSQVQFKNLIGLKRCPNCGCLLTNAPDVSSSGKSGAHSVYHKKKRH